MAVRVTEIEVETIIETETDDDLTPFIASANSLVTELCSDSDYTAARLKDIELWLSAHFYTVFRGRAASETVGPIKEDYEGQTAMYLSSSKYGQHAMLIDTAGNLAALNEQIKSGSVTPSVGVSWLGTEDTTRPDDYA